jgi:hypothetical protein
MPEVVPASVVDAGEKGINLRVPEGAVPPGGRRAGLTSHSFEPRMIGQEQRIHTGWMTSDGGNSVAYSPHTKTGYRLPASKALYVIACAALATRIRGARKAGLVS